MLNNEKRADCTQITQLLQKIDTNEEERSTGGSSSMSMRGNLREDPERWMKKTHE